MSTNSGHGHPTRFSKDVRAENETDPHLQRALKLSPPTDDGCPLNHISFPNDQKIHSTSQTIPWTNRHPR